MATLRNEFGGSIPLRNPRIVRYLRSTFGRMTMKDDHGVGGRWSRSYGEGREKWLGGGARNEQDIDTEEET